MIVRNLEEFNGRFSGRTCFIVGAGTSIAGLNLEFLKKHITIAVNSGYLAVPWADFFLSDDHSVSSWSYFFRDLRSSETTVLLYEEKLGKHAILFGNRSVIFRHCKGINIPDKYTHDDKIYHIGETRTSVGSSIMVAHIMGCSEIVLLGIDCCRQMGYRYFWQMLEWNFEKPFRNDSVPVDRYKKCKIAGEITDYDLVDISKTWDKLGFYLKRKCSVYNASTISKLTVFPKIDLNKYD